MSPVSRPMTPTMKIHLDTDLGGDPDDGCALAMLLGWPGVEVVGVTTSIDPGGARAGYVAHVLGLAGRADVPVAAGATASLTTGAVAGPDDALWPAGIAARPGPPGEALDLLLAGVDAGATVVAVGPYTNLALLETARPGTLGRVPVVVMGGWVDPPAAGLPPWGPGRDFNVQFDTAAARIVARTAGRLTLATLPATLRAPLRAADLPRLRACGPLGELLAAQSEAYAVSSGKAELGPRHPGLPDDLLNFHYDPVACALAVGWDGGRIRRRRLRPVESGGVLRFADDPVGRPADVLADVDGAAFTEAWLDAVAAAGGRR
jgi:inosine-uridine nucleoside N-ribohydrolase